MGEIYGAVFPVSHNAAERALSKERDVFAKFKKFTYLSKGHKIQFYDSSVHAVVGEAKVGEVLFLTPDEVEKRFGKRLILTKEEFKEYKARTPLGPREKKDALMTVCLLEKPRKYSKPKKLDKKMNMIGHYLRE